MFEASVVPRAEHTNRCYFIKKKKEIIHCEETFIAEFQVVFMRDLFFFCSSMSPLNVRCFFIFIHTPTKQRLSQDHLSFRGPVLNQLQCYR